MIGHIQELIENALEHLQAKGEFELERNPDNQHRTYPQQRTTVIMPPMWP